MRCCLAAIASFSCVISALSQNAPQTPDELYQAQAMEVIERAVLPDWGKHMDKIDDGMVTFHYRVYPDGRIADLKITSSTGNRLLEEMSLHSMQGVRLPPVPAVVLGHDPSLEMQTEIKPQLNE